MSEVALNPAGTSIYEELSIKPKPQPKLEKTPVVEVKEKTELQPKDESNVPKNTKAKESVDFVDTKESNFSQPIIDLESNKVLNFKVDKEGLPVLSKDGSLQPDEKGKPVFLKTDEAGDPLYDKDGNVTFVAPPKDFDASKVEANSKSKASEATQTPEETAKDSQDSGQIGTINGDDGQPVKFKVDDGGKPILSDKGELQPDQAGKPIFFKLDKEGQPLIDKKTGEPVFVTQDKAQEAIPQEVQKINSALTSHSAQRVFNGIMTKSAVVGGVKTVSNMLIKGAHVAIPFTEKAIGFGVKHAVAKAVGKELAEHAAKAGTTVIAKSVAKTVAKETTEVVAKAATEAAVKGLTTAATKTAAQTVAKSGAKAVAETTVKVVQKTMQKAGQEALEKGVTTAVQAGVKAAVAKQGSQVVAKAATVGAEKAVIHAAEKAAVQAGTKGAAKAGTKLASIAPVVGAVAGAAITAWDVKDAIEKTKDPKASKASAALAWCTVGLDVVSTAATATGIGAPIGWVATGLSIGTSIASDWLR
jgi:hypothetical protein